MGFYNLRLFNNDSSSLLDSKSLSYIRGMKWIACRMNNTKSFLGKAAQSFTSINGMPYKSNVNDFFFFLTVYFLFILHPDSVTTCYFRFNQGSEEAIRLIINKFNNLRSLNATSSPGKCRNSESLQSPNGWMDEFNGMIKRKDSFRTQSGMNGPNKGWGMTGIEYQNKRLSAISQKHHLSILKRM